IVSGGELRNETGSTISRVRGVFQPTERTVYSNQILPGRALKLGFSPREIQNRSVDLTWIGGDGREHKTTLGMPPIPPHLENQPLWVIYSVHPDGTATVRMQPAVE
ncbi:MAG: hypothetical protein KDB08_10820, partial [Microthrixaceae bacterium]|nr:hypothetical protein [Microthrixaceae bacterium]